MNACVMVEADVIAASDLSIHTGVTDSNTPIAVNERIPLDTERTDDAAPVPASLDEFKDLERERILQALKENNWNRVQAAKAIGMARRTFYRRLKQYEILV